MDLPDPTPNIPPERRARKIDPDLVGAARKGDMPDGSIYDTAGVDRTGPSNWYMLAAVMVAIGGMLLVLYIFI